MSSSPSARRRGGWRRRRCPSFSWIPSRKRRAQTGHRSWVTGPFGMQPPVLGASVFVCLVGTPHPSHHVSSFFFCRLFGCACAFVFFVWEGRSDDFRANMIHAEWSGGGVTKSMIRLFTRNQMQHDAQRSCRCFATHSAPQSPAGSIEPLSSSSSMIMKNGTCKLDMNNIYSSSSMILGSIQGFFSANHRPPATLAAENVTTLARSFQMHIKRFYPQVTRRWGGGLLTRLEYERSTAPADPEMARLLRAFIPG